MADFETTHDALDHTGLTGVGGGGSTPASARYIRTAGDYTTSSATLVDVDATNLALSITTGANRVMVGAIISGKINNAVGTGVIDVAVDGTDQGGAFGVIALHQHSTASELMNFSFVYLTDVLTAASHTFKLRYASAGGQPFTLAGAGTPPLVFWVAELA